MMNDSELKKLIAELEGIREKLETSDDASPYLASLTRISSKLVLYRKYNAWVCSLLELIENYDANNPSTTFIKIIIDKLLLDLREEEHPIANEFRIVAGDIADIIGNAGKEIGQSIKKDMPKSAEKLDNLKSIPHNAMKGVKGKLRNWLLDDDDATDKTAK